MNIKEEKGITLAILVITIVVMLILAGSVLISATGYGDIKSLKDLSNDLEIVREKVEIYYERNKALPVSNQITTDVVTLLGSSRNTNDGDKYYKVDLSELDNISLVYGMGANENDYFIINEQSHNVYYYAGLEVDGVKYYGIKDISQVAEEVDFGIQSFELKTRTNASVTDGVLDIQLEVYSDIESENISKCKFRINNGTWIEEELESTHVFHNLKQYETYSVSMMIIDANGNEIYATNNEEKVTIKELPINLTIDGKLTGTYNNPLIPAGFIAINENNAIWQSSDGYKNGLVITDEVDADGNSIGNEFVWVPVDGTNVTFAKKDYGFYYAGTFEEYLETLPTELTTSVDTNQGFYISRYEAGNLNDIPVSRAGKEVYNNIARADAQTLAESMYPETDTEHGVISTLIYGTQWDTALKFIEAYNVGEANYLTYATNSVGMGNYTGTSGGDTSSETPGETGALAAFRQKNIYDMAGNIWEITMESYNDTTVIRGGGYLDAGTTDDDPASSRLADSSADATIGFRVSLYIRDINIGE